MSTCMYILNTLGSAQTAYSAPMEQKHVRADTERNLLHTRAIKQLCTLPCTIEAPLALLAHGEAL